MSADEPPSDDELVAWAKSIGVDPYPIMAEALRKMGYTVTPPRPPLPPHLSARLDQEMQMIRDGFRGPMPDPDEPPSAPTRWRRWVKRNIIDDDPMDDERLRWEARKARQVDDG